MKLSPLLCASFVALAATRLLSPMQANAYTILSECDPKNLDDCRKGCAKLGGTILTNVHHGMTDYWCQIIVATLSTTPGTVTLAPKGGESTNFATPVGTPQTSISQPVGTVQPSFTQPVGTPKTSFTGTGTGEPAGYTGFKDSKSNSYKTGVTTDTDADKLCAYQGGKVVTNPDGTKTCNLTGGHLQSSQPK